MSELVTINDFAKFELRVATVLEAQKMKDADKLLVLKIDLGGEQRQIVGGVAKSYEPEALVGKQIVIIANLVPAKIRGVQSNGMLLAAVTDDGSLCVVTPDKKMPDGSPVH
jgi:methionyl-tRNA synthetase